MAQEATFRLRGEVDLASKDCLDAALASIIADDVDVVVDCSALTFIDSSGVHALVAARNALAARGHRLRMTDLVGAPRRVFEVLGLQRVLGIDGDADGAQQ